MLQDFTTHKCKMLQCCGVEMIPDWVGHKNGFMEDVAFEVEGHKGFWGGRLGEFSKKRWLQGKNVRTRRECTWKVMGEEAVG